MPDTYTSQYFYRNTVFSKQGNQIAIADIDDPENKKELEPWMGAVLQLADGQHTIDELYDYLASRYDGPPPANLMDTLVSVIERMEEAKLLVLTADKTELPYYLSIPIEMMDIDMARRLLEEDRAELN